MKRIAPIYHAISLMENVEKFDIGMIKKDSLHNLVIMLAYMVYIFYLLKLMEIGAAITTIIHKSTHFLKIIAGCLF